MYTFRLGPLVLTGLILACVAVGCAPDEAPQPDSTPTPARTETRPMSLEDAVRVLDGAPELAAEFKLLQSVSEDSLLGSDCSQFEVYFQEHPLLFVTAFICIVESNPGQSAEHWFWLSEADVYEAMKSRFVRDIVDSGGYLRSFRGEISHPSVGDMALQVTGSGIADYLKHGSFDFYFDNLAFQREEVFVILETYAYSPSHLISLDSYAQGIVERIDGLKI